MDYYVLFQIGDIAVSSEKLFITYANDTILVITAIFHYPAGFPLHFNRAQHLDCKHLSEMIGNFNRKMQDVIHGVKPMDWRP